MLSFLSSFLVSPAFADGGAMPPPSDNMSAFMRFMPLFLIFAVFYFLLIRPQQKQLEKQSEMLKSLKKGDKVVTSGGIIGTIVKTDAEDRVGLEIASGVVVEVLRSTITGLSSDKKAETK